ncbi:fibrobacter succinogenes major paralogous domain-containing protein [Fibrobacter sp.]|uniref:fibrobacter succinogenes major paralogous domain-containing protein n=1 Tax=Fibrobacter sp. TaxID=35828 RepID=UPI00388FCCEB
MVGLLVACGDEASDKSPVQVAEESSSSVDEVLSSSVNVEESSSSVESEGLSSSVESGASSSSEKSTESSSGKNTEPAEVYSCSVAEESSSSTTVEPSSSSVKVQESSSSEKNDVSSSSEKPVESSSSEKVVESSSSEVSSSSVVQPCKTKTEDNCIYGTLYDERDGKTYKTVKIGEQWWMAENLNYADSSKTASLMGKSWCYNNSVELCNKYGRLYTWSAAIDSVKFATDIDNPLDCGFDKNCTLPDTVYGICPLGWHLPSKDEWEKLTDAVGGKTSPGTMLKSSNGWNTYNNVSGNGSDSFGFSALPAGARYVDGDYNDDGLNAYFWCSTANDIYNANYMRLSRSNGVGLGIISKSDGFSIRCIKD